MNEFTQCFSVASNGASSCPEYLQIEGLHLSQYLSPDLCQAAQRKAFSKICDRLTADSKSKNERDADASDDTSNEYDTMSIDAESISLEYSHEFMQQFLTNIAKCPPLTLDFMDWPSDTKDECWCPFSCLMSAECFY